MALAVTTPAQYVRLTTLQRVKDELSLTTPSDDGLLLSLIDGASAAVGAYCRRSFAREVYSETTGGFGGIHLQLARTPLVVVSTVSWDSTLLTDYSIADAGQGTLYRQNGWSWTAQAYEGLHSSGFWLDIGWPLPLQEEPQFTVAYTAGYLMPEENVSGTTLSASSTDNSFNDSASGFPALLKAGDIISVNGFSTPSLNKRHVVSGTPTAAKVVVTSTLVTDAGGENVSIDFQTLPFDIEKACVETVKSYYLQRKDSSDWIEKQVGAMRLRKSEADGAQDYGIPPSAVGLLRPWVRLA